MERVEPDQLRMLSLDMPRDTVRIAYDGNSNLLPSSSNAVQTIETANSYRAAQLRTLDLRRAILQVDSREAFKTDKAETTLQLTSSLLADLAVKDNTRLGVVQENRRAELAAEQCFDRHKSGVMDIVKTLW